MADNDAGTTAVVDQAPEGTEPATGTEPQGTAPAVDEVTTLKSRNAGLDAKVTTLSQQIAQERAAREAAEARALELAQGKTNGDEELRAQLTKAQEVIAAAEKRAQIADIKATYPEAYSVLGDVVANMTPDALAAAEARFLGVPAESNRPPEPIGNNAARPQTGVKSIQEMNLAELKAYMADQFKDLTFNDLAQTD